jgi:hypothetical protein
MFEGIPWPFLLSRSCACLSVVHSSVHDAYAVVQEPLERRIGWRAVLQLGVDVSGPPVYNTVLVEAKKRRQYVVVEQLNRDAVARSNRGTPGDEAVG